MILHVIRYVLTGLLTAGAVSITAWAVWDLLNTKPRGPKC